MSRSAAIGPRPEGKRLILGGIAAFLATGAVLLLAGGRLASEKPAEPGFAVAANAHPAPEGGGVFEVTLDTSDSKHWVPFDLAAGAIRPTAADAAEADLPDLLIRRYVLRAPHGAIGLGRVPLREARLAPVPSWRRDEKRSGEVQNPAFKDWYRYSYWTHLLRSAGETYAVRLASGGVAYVQLVSYYCVPEGPGCLTLRYRLELDGAAPG